VLTREFEGELTMDRKRYVEQRRVDFDPIHRPHDATDLAGNQTHPRAAGRSLRHALRGNVLVARRHHLRAPRQVDPELETPELAAVLSWHLLVNDAASGGHPLSRPGPESPVVAENVAVLHGARDHVRHR